LGTLRNEFVNFFKEEGVVPIVFVAEELQDQVAAVLSQRRARLKPILGNSQATPLPGWGGGDQNTGVGVGNLEPGGQPSRRQPGRKAIKRGTLRHRILQQLKLNYV